ncbi:MAG: DUF547 domain-containing protein, partial [Betaproteobacteria bacterium]
MSAHPQTRRRELLLAGSWLALGAPAVQAQVFDHEHAAWTRLLGRHVKLINEGRASQVDYRGFARERTALKSYLDRLSAVAPAQYAAWNKAQQFAFLANA